MLNEKKFLIVHNIWFHLYKIKNGQNLLKVILVDYRNSFTVEIFCMMQGVQIGALW